MLRYDSYHFYACAVLISWLAHSRTWIADLWRVVGHVIILIDLAVPLIYVTSIVYVLMYSMTMCTVHSPEPPLSEPLIITSECTCRIRGNMNIIIIYKMADLL